MKKCPHWETLLVVLIVASSLSGQTVGTHDVSVTPVAGESWLTHLHRSFSDTSMGKTWDFRPAPAQAGGTIP